MRHLIGIICIIAPAVLALWPDIKTICKKKKHMNKKTRKEIQTIVNEIDDILTHINCIKDDEEEKYDNMPDNIQESERGEAMQDAIDNLDCAYDSIRDGMDYLQEIIDQ